MIVEGVNFNDTLVKKMRKREFIHRMKLVFFLDRPIEDRELLLGSIYDRIKGN